MFFFLIVAFSPFKQADPEYDFIKRTPFNFNVFFFLLLFFFFFFNLS